MESGRLLTWPLALFVVLVVAALAVSLWSRLPPDYAEAVQRLRDNDLEAAERQECLRVVVRVAVEPGRPERQLAGAMAAIALGDGEAYAAMLRRLSPDAALPVGPGVADRSTAPALGDPLLAMLLGAMWAEADRDAAAARDGYQRVKTAAALWQAPLAGKVAEAGLQRLH